MKLPQPNGAEFEKAPEGNHVAVCYRVIDIGTQVVEYKGQTKHQRKVQVSWELSDELMEDGRPFTIHNRYTWSMHEKSNLRAHLEAWRGKKFADSDFGDDGFDVENLLGKCCMLQIVHSESGYANIAAVAAMPKGQPKEKETVNDRVLLSLEPSEFDGNVMNALSESLQDAIRNSPEYQSLVDDGRKKEIERQVEAGVEEDIPF